MFSKTKTVFAVVLVLGTASGAFAATKHHGHKGSVVHGRVSASAYGANASANQVQGSTAIESGAMLIQDRDYRESVGTPWFSGK